MTSRRRPGSRSRNAHPIGRSPAADDATTLFPIVGVGASAGGLEAFVQLLSTLPADTGMGFVFIQHLDAAHPSLLREALAKATAMPVVQPVDGTQVKRDHVYVIPATADLTIHDGRLTLLPRPDHGHGVPHLPVDLFMRSLATECGSRAVGVVLSGTASDGTDGLRAIKAGGGITLVQEPAAARFPGMPSSAIDAGVVDHVLPIPALVDELIRLSRHPYVTVAAPSVPDGDEAAFAEILAAVRSRVGVDFSEYKRATLSRRVARRMALRRADDLRQYLALLHAEPDEVGALYEDVLIHVTSFFRDSEVYEILAQRVFPEILAHKADDAAVRLWVAGCSTGEEVYSLAITLLEVLGDRARQVQIFGSDVSARAIERARAGVYPDAALRELSDERRARWFVRTDAGHRIIKAVRDRCVFVEHDLARDPPFSKLDLVSCRNVLIYFEAGLQQRVISRLHYALNEPGYLLLGRTEAISGFDELFTVIDRTHKIFARSVAPSKLHFGQVAAPHAGAPPPRQRPAEPVDSGGNVTRHVDRLLLARYAPPGVVVDDQLDILSFRGETGAYLRPAPGKPQHNLMKMARGGLLSALRETVARAKQQQATVRAEGVTIDHDGLTRSCDVVVIPWAAPQAGGEQLYLVLFERGGDPVEVARATRRVHKKDEPRIATLEHELAATRDYLNALLDEQGRINDDLGSANEELVSGNEELQSMNEELETAKEELQSTNEELTTVNDELHRRNLELAQANGDLVNVLGTVDIPMLILDSERRLRRYTPKARGIARVQPSDVGRPIDDLKLHIDVADLDQQVAAVIATESVYEAEVQDASGRWYRMQIRPYHTTDGLVDGAILSLVDIDALKHLVGDAQQARGEAERANLSKDHFLATLSHELRSPLTGVLIHAQRLRAGGLDETKVRRAGEAIERGTRMQVQLIEDLLDVSRIVAGKLELRREPVDLAATIRTALEAVREAAERKRIRVVERTEAPGVRVAGDATRLLQVVSNLLTNAIKFTPDGGEVTVTLAAADGQARVDVTDTGVGIEAGFLPQVFDRFAQEDSSSTRIYGGLGLGLAIVRHLVELHGGAVRARSEGKGRGATLSVTLPLLAVTEAVAPASPPPVGAARGGDALHDVRILVIDDDAPTREAVAGALSQSGATVTLAASVAEAMVTVAAAAPDVVVCDLAMPGEDGYGFIRRLRALDRELGRVTPVLALTALAGAGDHLRALEAGFDRHLTKPIDTAQLVAAVAGLRPLAPAPGHRAEVC